MKTLRRLDEVCEVIMGQAPCGEAYNSDGLGWPLIAGAGDFGEVYPAAKKFTTEALKLSQPDDIILGIRASIGDKVLSDGVYCLGRGVAGLRPREELDKRYLWHWLTSSRWVLGSKAKGATFKQVNRDDIGSLIIPILPLPEQQRIAAILDQADALRTKRRAASDHLDTLKKSIFLEMFASDVSETWDLTTIEAVAATSPGSLRTGPFGSQLLHSEFVDSGVAVLGIDNAVQNDFRWAKPRYISPEKYKVLTRYTVHPGDVLITIMGTCGRCAIVPDDIPLAINTKHLCCITLDRTICQPTFLHSYFLHHPLAKQYLQRTAKGAVMDGLNMGIIRHLPLRLPPGSLQEEFGRRISALQSMEVADRQSASSLDDLLASLQHRAFRGDL